jgi:hypothetical protein
MTQTPASGRSRKTVLWIAGYLACMATIVGSLMYARQATLAGLGRPEAQAQWKADVERLSTPAGPVQRRASKSPEPPGLVLMRDHFPAIVGTSLAIGSFLFAFLAVTIRGSLHAEPLGRDDTDH